MMTTHSASNLSGACSTESCARCGTKPYTLHPRGSTLNPWVCVCVYVVQGASAYVRSQSLQPRGPAHTHTPNCISTPQVLQIDSTATFKFAGLPVGPNTVFVRVTDALGAATEESMVLVVIAPAGEWNTVCVTQYLLFVCGCASPHRSVPGPEVDCVELYHQCWPAQSFYMLGKAPNHHSCRVGHQCLPCHSFATPSPGHQCGG